MLDENGYPGATIKDLNGQNPRFDGGDTAAIIGTMLTLGERDLKWYYFRSTVVLSGPVRHPDETKWYGQPDRFSRDQLVAILCSYINDPPHMSLFLFNQHKKRLFLTAWNIRKNGTMDASKKFPDITGPEIWALWIRVRKYWPLYPLLYLLDLETIAGSISWRFFRKDNVSRNHMLVCIASNKKYSTIVMKLAYLILNWYDLIKRWETHCILCNEYPTADLFFKEINRGKPWKRSI